MASVAAGAAGAAGAAAVGGPPLRRKMVSYEHYDDENADGGPTPAPSSSAQQDHPRKRQRRQPPPPEADHIDQDENDVGSNDGDHDDDKKKDKGSSVEAEQRPNQGLPVADLPRDFNGTPVSGDEYLFLVRREAEHAPRFTRAHNPYGQEEPEHEEPDDDDAPSSSRSASNRKQAQQQQQQQQQQQKEESGSLPDPIWRQYQLQRFEAMRHTLQNTSLADAPHPLKPLSLPEDSDRESWFRFIHNKPPPPGLIRSDRAPKSGAIPDEPAHFNINALVDSGRTPTFDILLRLSQPQIRIMLRVLADTIARFSQAAQDRDHNAEHTAQRDVLTPLHARWIFSLLTVLDGHLTSDHLDELRNVARTIMYSITIDRFSIYRDKSDLEAAHAYHLEQQAIRQVEREHRRGGDPDKDEEKEEEEEEEDFYWTEEHDELYDRCVCPLNRIRREGPAWMLITLVTSFWAQHDLLEEADRQLQAPETR
ncbi:hypothetical protein A4X06_0g4731 [Tilletia controversa]|uniref:Uncharacterized protein n=1 Tax=Tilletia controversa TaxID=13291 RepID=A0A8X7SWS2_9BASI|nr:hypothetical protein CF328_g2128 [Tilletia controversa]KAE8247057.1 hypothetical protein A4X06_0g4731 [Tilletia controversa]